MEYKSSAVRHLAWCLFSEPMAVISNIAPLTIKPSQTLLDWLTQLDAHPQALQDYLAEHNSVLLGSYFECLWQFFFQYSPSWNLLDHHIQIRQEKQTLGELDILACNTEDNQAFHIELAVKFYLKQPQTSGNALEDWLGPQSHDRLDLKLEKLSHKQLPFLNHEATQTELSKRNLPTNVKQALVLKGYLFEPWQAGLNTAKTRPHHNSIHPNANLRQWLHHKDCQTLFSDANNWVVLPKHHWLGPYHSASNAALPILSSEAAEQLVNEHFSNSTFPYALMLAQLSAHGEPMEHTRFMLVHDEWPNKAVN